MTMLFAMEIKFVLKIESNIWGFERILALLKWGETLYYVICFSLHLLSVLTASCVLYNRTEHIRGLSIY